MQYASIKTKDIMQKLLFDLSFIFLFKNIVQGANELTY